MKTSTKSNSHLKCLHYNKCFEKEGRPLNWPLSTSRSIEQQSKQYCCFVLILDSGMFVGYLENWQKMYLYAATQCASNSYKQYYSILGKICYWFCMYMWSIFYQFLLIISGISQMFKIDDPILAIKPLISNRNISSNHCKWSFRPGPLISFDILWDKRKDTSVLLIIEWINKRSHIKFAYCMNHNIPLLANLSWFFLKFQISW